VADFPLVIAQYKPEVERVDQLRMEYADEDREAVLLALRDGGWKIVIGRPASPGMRYVEATRPAGVPGMDGGQSNG
jgi:hypothetical protein